MTSREPTRPAARMTNQITSRMTSLLRARADTHAAGRVSRPDLAAAATAFALVVAASVTGAVLYLNGHPVQASAAPLFAHWRPHAGLGTPAAVVIAVLVWWRGPALAARLSWRRLTLAAYGVAVVWSLTLALVDGWSRGVAGRLATRPEYLHEVGGVTDIPGMLREFTSRILAGNADSWTTHVSGHPPGALLTFVALDRIGLSGGGWAGMVCIAVGALAAIAVPHTVRLLGADDAARAAVPFAVLFPGAVWAGVSADGLFAGVTATGVALLAHALTRGARTSALAGGVLLGFGCYLSYGLVLLIVVVAGVLIAAGWRWGPLAWAAAGAAAVVVIFTAYGFWWLDGYHLVIERYYQGIASIRPYGYWVWANLAALAVSAGPVAAVILRRSVPAAINVTGPGPRPVSAHSRGGTRVATSLRQMNWRPAGRAPAGSDFTRWRLSGADQVSWLLPVCAAVAILAADLSGYSKAEVERIWLPFAWWLTAGAALVPADQRRFWLAAQALTALAVNHLLLTTW
ncbi:hypothetical protein C8E87_8521 [Paractinoplanes brasiliensis]|uniref:Integral membrane protein n=2 Tax=Paractinoplanes brasiliensis TaxID=52695 RepID=A0A4R6JBC5_9ACTN|nr:hypothetical protein C8E87_8521 [Actinoplanes brasiliensis]